MTRLSLTSASFCPLRIVTVLALLVFTAPAAVAYQKSPAAAPTDTRQQPNQAASSEEPGDGAAADADAGQQPNELSEADRIAGLQSSIDDDDQRLLAALNELKTINDEFEAASREFAEFKADVERMSNELKRLRDDGKTGEAASLENSIQEKKVGQALARERFELAIQAQRTAQLQITTLQEKLKKSRAALDRLKGVIPEQPVADNGTERGDIEASVTVEGTSSSSPVTAAQAAETSNQNASAVDESVGATDVASTEFSSQKETPISEKAEAAQLESQQKSLAADAAEKEIQDVSDRKRTLEQDIALEQQMLENARDRHDVLDESLIGLEAELRTKLSEEAAESDLNSLRDRIKEMRGSLRSVRTKIRDHTDRLQALRSQLLNLQSEELLLADEAEQKRREADAARRNEWLITLTETLKVKAPKVALVLLTMLVLRWLANLLSRRIVKLLARASRGTAEERENRASTLVGVFRSTVLIAIVVGGTLMILDIAGVPIGPLLGGAAVFGLAIAFGAQNLIRDYFYGFMILLENQYRLKDVATIAGTTGVVEQITLRLTVLRDLNGHVHFIPNGTITSVTNHTHGWSQAVFDVGVAYKEDVDYVMQVLLELGRELKNDPVFGRDILDDPEMCGVNEFGDSAVVIRMLLKTKYNRMWPVKREMNRRIKNRFDELGIEIPFPHRTLVFQNTNQSETMNVASAHS